MVSRKELVWLFYVKELVFKLFYVRELVFKLFSEEELVSSSFRKELVFKVPPKRAGVQAPS